ncbi:MAG: phenylalanine--tRNA ligase subunit alpha [bacterium]
MMKKEQGHIHPLSKVTEDIERIFSKLGFGIADGPEIETEYYNFDALNIPANHPARDMWDTFWLKPENSKKLLRTHTSPVQVRYAETHNPPFKIIVPGKTYRHEATDSTHEAQFHQVEGLVVGKDISLANLRWTLEQFFQEFFGAGSKVRMRPSFFPFTEPSVEIDVWFPEQNKWLEIMGAGLVHPKVIKNFGLDPNEWSGYAFGGGIERLAILKYRVPDIRMFASGDLRLTNQF